MKDISKNYNGGSILPSRTSTWKNDIRKIFYDLIPKKVVHIIQPYNHIPAQQLDAYFQQQFTGFNHMINNNYPDSINKVKVYLIFTYFLKDNIFHPILAISDKITGRIDIRNNCYQLVGEKKTKKTKKTKKSLITQRTKIKASIAKMRCTGVYDHNMQIQTVGNRLTIKAFAFIGYFTPSFHHTNYKSSSNTIAKATSTRTQKLLSPSNYRSKKISDLNLDLDNHEVSSSDSVKKFIDNIEKGGFNKDNYSLNNNNCQTFCKNALNYLKKITSNNEFYSPTYTLGNNKVLHMVDIPLIQSHKAIRSSIDSINSAALFASDAIASTRASIRTLKLKPISEEITDTKAKGITKSTIRRQHQLRQRRQQNRRKRERERERERERKRSRKSKHKKPTSNRPRRTKRSRPRHLKRRKQHTRRKHSKTKRL